MPESKTLVREDFKRAVAFINTSARPLEQARFRFHFESGSRREVLAELARFQNSDGGFGRGLEPDYRSHQSSVLATSTALVLFRRLALPAGHPLVAAALRFLIESYDPDRRIWRFIPPTAGDAPHAPWWAQDKLEENFDGFTINPRAALLGYLLDYRAAVPESIVQPVYSEVMTIIQSMEGPCGVNDIQCLLALLASSGLPDEDRGWLREKIGLLIGESVSRQVDSWSGYVARPLDLIQSPESPYYPTFRELVESHLDFEIDHQAADGSWEPTWSWFGSFEDSWPRAKQDWQGVLTVENLLILQAFGRLEKSI